jgi:DNA-binding NarL/FixJ family response regulator
MAALMKILIADDHWVVRESLKQVMRKVSRTFEPFEAATFEEALGILRQHGDIELMLVDLIMPGFEEFAGLKRLRSEFPEIPIVVISVHEDFEYVVQSINHGVIGYIPKSAGAPEIIRALTLVLSGEVAFPRAILERSRPGAPERAERPRPTAAEVDSRAIDRLTNREREVLGLLGRGLSAGRIAEELSLSPHTVRVHVGNLMRKLGLKDRSAAIHYAVNVARGGRRG